MITKQNFLAGYSRRMEISTTKSPAVATSLTTPTPLAYHLSSMPASSIDHYLVFTQPVNVPAVTVTVSLVAMICAMFSATL